MILIKHRITLFFLVLFTAVSTTVHKPTKNPNKEDVKQELILGFANFVECLRPFYAKDDTYGQFKQKALHGTVNTASGTETIPEEGELMLKKAYAYLSVEFTHSQVLSRKNYKTFAATVLYINNQAKARNTSFAEAQHLAFGNDVLASNLIDVSSTDIEWWQLSNHLQNFIDHKDSGRISASIVEQLRVFLEIK